MSTDQDNILSEAPLTAKEEVRFAELEKVIEDNFKGFVAVGTALAEIRDLRLYRRRFKRFEEYCKHIWEMSHQRADQLIASKKVIDNLTTIVVKTDKTRALPLPSNEAQARELSLLDPKEQAEAWQQAVAEAEEFGIKITAKLVKKAVKTRLGEKIDKAVNKTREKVRENRTDFKSEEFAAAYDTFLEAIMAERQTDWRNTSRKTVYNNLKNLLEVVGDISPGAKRDDSGCQMELTEREKLKEAGFRIFKRDVRHSLILEWEQNDLWPTYQKCLTPAKLKIEFEKLMKEPRHLRG